MRRHAAPGLHAVEVVNRVLRVLPLLLAVAALGGCAAIALPALGAGALSGGASSVVKASTEYSSTGVAYRTFSADLDDVRAAALQSLYELQIDVHEDEATKQGGRIEATAGSRTVQIRLERITPVLTRMRLVVKQSLFRRDRSTASELVTRTEHALAAIAPSAFPSAAAGDPAAPSER